MSRATAQQRALWEWRDAHPQDADLTDAQIGSLLRVQIRAEQTFCPRCHEIECDDDCRNYELRAAAGMWIEAR